MTRRQFGTSRFNATVRNGSHDAVDVLTSMSCLDVLLFAGFVNKKTQHQFIFIGRATADSAGCGFNLLLGWRPKGCDVKRNSKAPQCKMQNVKSHVEMMNRRPHSGRSSQPVPLNKAGYQTVAITVIRL